MLGWTWSLKHETFCCKWCTKYYNLKKMSILYIKKDLASLALIGSSYNYAQYFKGKSILYKIKPFLGYYIDHPYIGNLIVYNIFNGTSWGVNFILVSTYIQINTFKDFHLCSKEKIGFENLCWHWKWRFEIERRVCTYNFANSFSSCW